MVLFYMVLFQGFDMVLTGSISDMVYFIKNQSRRKVQVPCSHFKHNLYMLIPAQKCGMISSRHRKEKKEAERSPLSRNSYTIDTHALSELLLKQVIVAVPPNCMCLHEMCVWVASVTGPMKLVAHTRIPCKHTQFGGTATMTSLKRSSECACVSIVYALHQCKVATFSFFLKFFLLWVLGNKNLLANKNRVKHMYWRSASYCKDTQNADRVIADWTTIWPYHSYSKHLYQQNQEAKSPASWSQRVEWSSTMEGLSTFATAWRDEGHSFTVSSSASPGPTSCSSEP